MLSTHNYCRILMKLEFSRQIFKNTQILNLIKIRPMGAELFHADGQTDMTKLTVAFRNFGNAPKNRTPYIYNTRYFFQSCYRRMPHKITKKFRRWLHIFICRSKGWNFRILFCLSQFLVCQNIFPKDICTRMSSNVLYLEA